MQQPDWYARATSVAILFALHERGASLPLLPETPGQSVLEDATMVLMDKGFLSVQGKQFVVTPKGAQVLQECAQRLEVLGGLRIFQAVRPALALPEGVQAPDNPDLPYADLYDPRFARPGDAGADLFDLRCAMYEAVGASLGGLVNPATGTTFAPVDTAAHLEELWFLLMLGTDAFAPANDWWLALGTGQFHQQAQAVIEHRYKWQHLAEGPEDALAAAKALYAAGIIEDRKRSGYECSCGAALALFEAMARDEGRHLTTCPRCGQSWTDPTAAPGVTTYACGECQAPVRATQDRCRHCGVLLDFVGPPGTRTTVFRRETTTTYRHYGWADPFCPWVDYPRFTLLARPIIVIA